MTLKELIKKLKAFDCEALRDKEVSHYFATDLGYGYEEVVTDVKFDPKNGRIVLSCSKPKSIIWDSNLMLRVEEEQK